MTHVTKPMHHPGIRIPAKACDCHIHVYDDRFPASPDAKLRPSNASISQYIKLQSYIGMERAVLVTPSTYGTDNRCMLEGLQAMGDRARAVAVIDGSEDDAHLAMSHEAGVRGVRLNLSLGVVGKIEWLKMLSQRIAPLGWHIQILMAPDQLAQHEVALHHLPVQIVFDHFARISPAMAYKHPAHRIVLDLLRERKAWVKVSGGYIVSDEHDAADPNLNVLARSFIAAASDRVIWGSDWPHATAMAGHHPMPDDATQVERLCVWANNEATLHRILVSNPGVLYGFPD